MHFEPNSIRYSNDLDYFHDSETRVASAFKQDSETLRDAGINLTIELHQPCYIRAVARQGIEGTKIEWAHDSAWRFMPTRLEEGRGYCLHPVDLAINKVLALAGRDEARDFIDVMHASEHLLALPGLVWAACGKDPGFSPNSLLELLKRKGKYRQNDFDRLRLAVPIDLQATKQKWLELLSQTESSLSELPPENVGCLFFHTQSQSFGVPTKETLTEFLPHFATEGGILPRIDFSPNRT